MSRIKGRYVAKVVLEWNVLRKPDMRSLEKIKHTICNGEVTNAIKEYLSGYLEESNVTVEQMYADVYEVDEDGTL